MSALFVLRSALPLLQSAATKRTRIERIERIMDAKDILTIEDYKKRISDLIDELEKEIGIKIQNVDITPKVGLMNIRGVKFNIEL